VRSKPVRRCQNEKRGSELLIMIMRYLVGEKQRLERGPLLICTIFLGPFTKGCIGA